MGIAEFLSARIDEDEVFARAVIDAREEKYTEDFSSGLSKAAFEVTALSSPGREHVFNWGPYRVLREVETKRDIIDYYLYMSSKLKDGREHDTYMFVTLGEVLNMMTQVYVDHPDFKEEWREL